MSLQRLPLPLSLVLSLSLTLLPACGDQMAGEPISPAVIELPKDLAETPAATELSAKLQTACAPGLCLDDGALGKLGRAETSLASCTLSEEEDGFSAFSEDDSGLRIGGLELTEDDAGRWSIRITMVNLVGTGLYNYPVIALRNDSVWGEAVGDEPNLAQANFYGIEGCGEMLGSFVIPSKRAKRLSSLHACSTISVTRCMMKSVSV